MTGSELRRVALTLSFVALFSAPSAAWADAPSAADRTLAESLFRDAKKLMTAKRFSEACPLLVESQRLDPGGGTLLNLAACHEGEGKTATAWAEYSEALSVAKQAHNAARVKAAKKRIDGLEPRLSRLTVSVDGITADVEVRVDGVVLPKVAWGQAARVDRGTHRVSARAEGRIPFETEVAVGAAHDTKEVKVPPLELMPAPPPAPSPPAVESPPPAAVVVAPPPPPSPPPAAPPPSSARRTGGLILGGVGLVGVGVGAALVGNALLRRSDSDAACQHGCTQAGVDAMDSARASANVANAAFGVGVVGLGIGAYLLLTAPRASAPPPAALVLRPGGAIWSGTF